jgi:predicted ArsR family transcriptional regulator
MTTHHNTPRGEAVRAALVAIVRARAVADLPLPTHRAMAAALGISAPQVTRHMAVLQDAGAFRAVNAGMRVRVEELRP